MGYIRETETAYISECPGKTRRPSGSGDAASLDSVIDLEMWRQLALERAGTRQSIAICEMQDGDEDKMPLELRSEIAG
jgi:hypothetical protein